MRCEKCKKIVVMNAFSEGDCEVCGRKVVTSHMPCHKVCNECSEEHELCEQCGKRIAPFLKKSKTNRGFNLLKFKDLYEQDCSIQESSLATDNAIWIGIHEAKPKIMASKIIEGGVGWAEYPIPEDVFISTRMHLNREQVKELLPILQKFVDTGEI